MSKIQEALNAAREAERAVLLGAVAIRSAMRGGSGLASKSLPLVEAVALADRRLGEAVERLASAPADGWREALGGIRSPLCRDIIGEVTGWSMACRKVAIDALKGLVTAREQLPAAAAAIAEVDRLSALRDEEIRRKPAPSVSEYEEWLAWDQYEED